MEVFYEAVPSTLVMTYLLVRAMRGAPGDEIIYDGWDTNNTRLFYVAFFTSIITSSLGLAKNLKVGPCRILPQQKRCLGGLLAPRFILIFLACGVTLISKGTAFALVFGTDECDPQGFGETLIMASLGFELGVFDIF